MKRTTKTITILFFIAIPFVQYAQKPWQKIDNKFSIGVSFSLDHAYRSLSEQVDYVWVDGRNVLETPRLGFTTGIVAKYRFTNKIALQSGVQFLDKGYKIVVNLDDWVSSGEIIDPGFIIDDPAIPNNVKMKYHYSYFGIPVKMNYYFLERKVRAFVSAGVSTDFFLSGKIKSIQEYSDRTDEDSTEIDQDFNKINFTGIVGLGLEATVCQNLELRLEPVFRYAFSSLWKDTSFREHPYSIGANLVLFWGF